ncbi:hypothetical protein SBD_3716 [Streptomyces bottropensis ATCC 25435]|uniref:Uncharacterized protein n=1 Tax=Streptomyces bottropensis ATCC 25435 TaxID=1054862 RepID=M3EXT7_9ACTN|nr:hypothetical protein SBD_3716 [Streptomyces bottropensis ATCC 25435]
MRAPPAPSGPAAFTAPGHPTRPPPSGCQTGPVTPPSNKDPR